MSETIGFVILTHNNPDQCLFLCNRLSTQFERPRIVIHHDFGQCSLDTSRFPQNVIFVKNWNSTHWGGVGVVDGLLKALHLLYEDGGPDWFVVLSGADYPVKPAKTILRELSEGGFDAYIDHRKISKCLLPMPREGWGGQNYIHPAWIRLAYERYMAIGFGFYKLAKRMKWRRRAFYLRSEFLIRLLTPFNDSVHCYAGDFWFTANRNSARALLAKTERNMKIIAHFRKRPNPDEGMFQTLLCNAKTLRICTDNKRYTDWSGCVNHPRMLGAQDFSALLSSGDHFARKFSFDPETLRKLDCLVDNQSERIAPEKPQESVPESAEPDELHQL